VFGSPSAQFFKRRGVWTGVEGCVVVHVRFAVEDAGGLEPVPSGDGSPVPDLQANFAIVSELILALGSSYPTHHYAAPMSDSHPLDWVTEPATKISSIFTKSKESCIRHAERS
jgi:hypothetical protein